VKPPKAPPPKGQKKRKRGAQPGHPRHERAPFPPDEIDEVHEYSLTHCPDCSTRLRRSDDAPRVVQQVEIVERPIRVAEHRARAYWCPSCEKTRCAPIPAPILRAGLVGPRLTALTAHFKGPCHASYSTVQRFFGDVFRFPISRGQLRNIVGKVTDALERPHEELRDRLPTEERLNVDETGHKNNGKLHWTWVFRALAFTVFLIRPSRGHQVLVETLGKEFAGVLGCDYYNAYRAYMKKCGALVQFCLAHLIRDVRFLTTVTDKVTRNYGERLLDELRALFRVIHRREQMAPEAFQAALERQRDLFVQAAKRAPPRSEAQNIAKRFRNHGKAYVRFITTPDVAPTNNLAEQALRFVVIDRKITQGTRSPKGQRWCERIWTAAATCAQQGRSVFEFLCGAVEAHFHGTTPPSLLPEAN
jgi:transposase